MAYKEVSRVDVTEVVRRWQMGYSQRQTVPESAFALNPVLHLLQTYLDCFVMVEFQPSRILHIKDFQACPLCAFSDPYG